MGLFDEEEEFLNQGGVPDYGRPSSTFSEESQASRYSPAQEIQFRGFRENLDYRKGVIENAKSSSEALSTYQNDLDTFKKNHIDKAYYQAIGTAPPSGLDGGQVLNEIKTFGQNQEGFDLEGIGRLEKDWTKRFQTFQQYQARDQQLQQQRAQVETFNSQVDPIFRSAFSNWEATTGGRKPNGSPSKLMDPKRANEILDFLNFREPTRYEQTDSSRILSSDLKDLDPRYKIKGNSEYAKSLNEKQLERRKALLRGDFESLFGEHERANKLRGAGMHIAPSWKNQIGGVSRILGSPQEREAVLFSHAHDSGLDYFTDSSGQKRDIQEFLNSTDYTPEEIDALKMMNVLGQANTEYNDRSIALWSSLKDMTEKDKSEALNELELIRNQRDQTAQMLDAMGYGRDIFSRAESIQDIGTWTGWIKTGSIQDDIADFSDNLMGDASNMSSRDFEQLSRFANQQDYLGQLMQKNGQSPLSKLMSMSDKEKDGWFEAVGRWFSMDGIKAVAELTVTNLSGFLPEYFDNAPAVIGGSTLTGAVVGGGAPGAATGFALGAKANWGVTSVAMEYAANVLQSLKEEGVDVHNPKIFAAAWANDELRQKIQKKAGIKAGVVGLFDAVSAGMAGKVNAVMKSPSVLKTIPSSFASKNKNLKGLTVEGTQRLKQLRKDFKANKFQDTSKEFAELQKLEGGVKSKFFQTETPFSKAIANANARVDRTTGLLRARNAAVELGFGGATGAAGEGFGQLLSREPGEAFDKQAVIAEFMGEVAGPGLIGAVNETARAPDLRYTQGVKETSRPIAPTNDPNDPYGYTGPGLTESMNNNGWKYEKVGFENSVDSVSFLAKAGNLPLQITDNKGKQIDNPEIQFLKEFVTGVEGIMKRKNLQVKYVVSDRTPEGAGNIGYQKREGNDYVVYINQKALNQRGSSIGSALIHELPHVIGTGFYGDAQVEGWYNQLTKEQQLQALSHYMFKDTDPNTPINQLNDKQQTELNTEYAAIQSNPEAKARAAQEWFSFEFARVLASGIKEKGQSVDITDANSMPTKAPSALPAGINNDILDFVDQYIYPMYKKYIGSGQMVMPDVAGDRAAFTDGGAKPEKMGPEQMYAQILYDMNWGGMGPGGDVAYQGPNKPRLSRATSVADMPSLFANQNKLIDDARTMGPLMKVAGEPGFERVKVGKNEQDISIAPDPDSISTPEDILSAFETQVDQEMQSTGLPSEPASFTPEQEQQMRANLERQFDRQVLKSQTETDPNILKGDKAQDTASALKDVATKEGPIATSRKKLDRLNKALEEAQKKNKSSIRYQGEERTLGEIRNIISEEEANLAEITAPVEKAMEAQRLKLNTKQKKEVSDGKVTFKPDVLTNQKGETIANPATKKETINLAQRSRDEVDNFVKLVVGKTKKRPEQIAKDLDKALQAKPEDLQPKLEKIAKQLLAENKRVTTEEVFSRFVEDLGVPILAETNKRKARALLSENAEIDPESIDEAYAQMESTTEELMGTIDLSINSLDLEVQAEEQLQSQMEISEAPKLEEGKDTLNDSQVTGLVKSIKALFQTYEPKEGSQDSSKKQINDFLISKLKGDPAKVKEIASELTELIQSPGVLSDTKDIKSKVSGISKKLDVLINPPVTEQTSETSVNAVDMSEKRARIRELLSSGAVTGLDRDASLVKIAKSKEEVSKKKATVEQLKDLKTAISLGTDTGNVDYRDTPVDIKIVPDDSSIKGTDFSQLVTSDNRKVTLGDLAANDKLKVKYANDSKGRSFTINGPQYLDKLADNYNWENDQSIVSDFESRNPGVSYAEYGTRLLAAIASRRPGTSVLTKRGQVPTSFFSADQGINKTAMLFEKVDRLGKALRKKAPGNSFLSMMEPYKVAFARQEREAEALRAADPAYVAKQKQLETFYDLILGPDRGGKRKGDSEDLRKIIEGKNFARIKDALIADKENNSLELSMLKEIEGLLKKKRKLNNKKITVADGRELLGLGIKQMREGSRKVERPIPMLSKDLLNLNLTASRIAEEFLSEDSENIGVVMYNKRVADFALSTDANLLNDLAVVNELINTGVGPRTTLSEGANIIKGDLFPFRNRLYRAHKSFQVNSESIQKIDQYANPAERVLPDDHRGVEKLTEKQLKDLETSRNNILKALKRLGSLSRNQFFPSDALSGRPTVTDQAGNLQDVSASALDILSGPIETKQYKHLVSMAYEYAAERGVNNSYMQKMPTKSKGKSHMEHTHVEDFLAKSDFNKALVEKQVKGLEDNLMSLPEAAKRALEMLITQQKKALETDTYVNYDPEGLDAPLNLAREWVNALNNAEPKVQRLLGVKDAKGRMVYDLAEIQKTPYLKKQFDAKMEDIRTLSKQGGFPLHFDNMKFKSDPVVSALSADPDQHNFVRDALRAEALKEGKRETERYTVTVSKSDVKRIFKDTSLIKSGTFTTVSKSNKNNFEFTFDPQMDRDVKVTFQKSTFFDPRFEDLRNFDRSSPANRVLFRKGEKLVLNGSRYTVKQNIDLKSVEGQELLAITSEASFNSNRPLSSSATEFQRLFDSNTNLFSKAKANSKVQDAVVSKDNEYIADAINTLKKAKERKDQELKSMMSDPRSGNPELVGNLEKSIKELDRRISSVENFFDNPDPKSWDLLVEHQGNFVKTSVKKEGGEFKLYYKEKGNFINPKTGRAVGTEVSNKLFNLLRVKYDLNFDSPDGSKRNAAIEAMSSFSTTPRELVTRLIDIGGVENIGMLSSSHSKYYADSVGGIMLLEYLDSAPDKLLASLEKSGGVDKIIKNLREKVNLFQNPQGLKGMNKVDFDQLSSDLEFFEKVKESGIKLQDAAIINYVSEFKINRLKNSPAITQDKKISEKLSDDDKNLLSDLINDDNPDSVFSLATREDLNLKNNQPIKLGRVEAKKDADGNVVTKARDIFGVVKVRSVDEDGSVVKLDYEQKPEDFEVYERWPLVPKKAQKEGASEKKQKAFLYDIEIQELQSDSEQSIKNLLYESEKQKFIDFKPEERKLASSLSESLSKLAESPEKKYIELSRQALKAYSKADYVYQQDRSLHEDIVEDIVNGDKMLKSKLRFLTRAVFHMGGMRISTAEDIIAEQRAIDKEANTYSPDSENISGDGQSSGPQKTEDEANPENTPDSGAGWETLFDQMDDDSYVDPGLSSNYSTSMFSKTRGPGLLSLFADAFTRRYNLWKNKKINEKLENNELDLGKGAIRGHDGIYGKFVEQFGPFKKLEKSLLSALNTDDKGLREKGLKAYDKFYQGMGMSGQLLDEGNRMYVNPIKDALYESQVDLQDLGWYLYALTAPQANAAIKSNRETRMNKPDIVDPETGESMGSGMTNSQAQEIIERLEGNSNMAKFLLHRNNPIKTLFDMHQKSLELMRDSELIDTDSYDRMKGAAASKFKFKHRLNVNFGDFRRLPLKGVFDETAKYQNDLDIASILSSSGTASGKGFDMPRGPMKMAATGREYNTLANIETIFAHTAQDYSDAVIRAMRSKSANAINNIYNELQAEKEAGNEAAADLFKRLFADNKKLKAKVKNTVVNGVYSLQELEVPPEIKDPALALFVREDGEPKLIMFSDKAEGALLASSAKNLTYEQLGSFLGFINISTKYMSRIRTSYSPEFWLRNPIKDSMTAYFNLKESKEFADIAGKVANPLKISQDALGIMKYEKNKDKYGKILNGLDKMDQKSLIDLAKKDITAAYHLLEKEGGKTAFYKFESVPEILASMQKAARKGREGNKLQQNLKLITATVDRLNTSLENVLRARVVMEGLKAGKDLEALITEARNVTVDFNKRGTMSQQLNAIFQFANPGIQGNRRFAKALASRGLVGGVNVAMKIAMLSFAYNTLVRTLTARGEDENDDYSTYLDDVSARQRHTGMIIPHRLFGDESKSPGYTQIPIGIGPHSFWALGEHLSKTFSTGGKHIVRDSLELASSMWGTMSPISSFPLPFADPFFDLARNTQFTGSPIFMEGVPGAPSEASQRSTSKIYNDISDWINEAAGGSKEMPGSMLGFFGKDPIEVSGLTDVALGGRFSGSAIDFLVNQYGGSLADNIMELLNMKLNWADATKGGKINLPVIKGVLKTRGSAYASVGKYYDLRERYVKAKTKLDSLLGPERKEFLANKDHKHYVRLIQVMNSAENQMNMYTRKKRVLEAKEQTSDVIQQLDKLEEIRINTIRGVLRKALDMGLDV